jgi:hypothetical protein
MHAAGKMSWSIQSALDKCLVDKHLGGDVRQFASLWGFDLLSHRFKVSPHSVNANRNTVDERKRLRVLREHRRKDTWHNVFELTQSGSFRVCRLSVGCISDRTILKRGKGLMMRQDRQSAISQR